MKNFTKMTVLALVFLTLVVLLAGCSKDNNNTNTEALLVEIQALRSEIELLKQTSTADPGEKGETGDKGPIGDKGETGDKGAAGEKGLDGEKGEPGDKGATGVAGPAGEKGETGEKGPIGDQGPAGDKGPAGEKGETGDKGATGDQGPAGEKGETGDKGATGEQGPAGEKGETGDKGATGDRGPAGEKGETGDKGATGDQGPAGEKGETGDKGSTGDKGPAGDAADLTNLDNLIASSIYTLQREYDLGDTIDIYCNGEIVYSIIIRLISPSTSSFNLSLNIITGSYPVPATHIADLLRVEGVTVNGDNIKSYTFLNRSDSGSTKIMTPNEEYRIYPCFGNNAQITNATYFNVFLAIPGTYIPMASINNISKVDYLNYGS